MKFKLLVIASFVFVIGLQNTCVSQTDLLDNVTVSQFETLVNDVVYDSVRDVLYATIPDSVGGELGNSIATIDPNTGALLDSVFVGPNPNAIAISDDASHVFVGIDGTGSIRSWQPGSGTLSAPTALSLGILGRPSVAFDIAVSPGRPSSAIVSVDDVGTTANGDLQFYDGNVVTDLDALPFNNANFIGFTNETTLVGFDDSNTGFTGVRFDFTENTLNLQGSQNRLVNNFNIEAEVGTDGILYFTDGTVVDPETFSFLGTVSTGLIDSTQLVEAVPELDIAYFVGSRSLFNGGDIVFSAFDLNTFLQIDSVTLPISTDLLGSRGELIVAGEDRLAFVSTPGANDGRGGAGTLNFINGVPTAATVPEPTSLALIALVGGIFVARRRRSSIAG